MLDFEHGFENVEEDEYDYYSRAFSYDYGLYNDDNYIGESMKFQVARPAAGLMEIRGYKDINTDTRSLFKRVITAIGRFVVGTIKFVIKYSVLLGIWTALFIWINHITVQDPTVEAFGRMIIELIYRFRAFIFNLF
jgi:hypothetical protein